MPAKSEAEREILIEEGLALIPHVVYQTSVHFPAHVDRDELFTAGAFGLIDAVDRFDPERGVPFAAYASRRIRGSILDSLRALDWAPRGVRSDARRLHEAEIRLHGQFGRPPTPAELADDLGVTQHALASIRDRVNRAVLLTFDRPAESNDHPDDDAVAQSIGEMLADQSAVDAEGELEHRELLAYLHDAVALLPDRQRLVIEEYFLNGRMSTDIAEDLGVSESRISQIRTEALETLRYGIEAQYDDTMVSRVPPATTPSEMRGERYARAIAMSRDWIERISVVPMPA